MPSSGSWPMSGEFRSGSGRTDQPGAAGYEAPPWPGKSTSLKRERRKTHIPSLALQACENGGVDHWRNRVQSVFSFRMRARNVCGLMPSTWAAPPRPLMRPSVGSNWTKSQNHPTKTKS